MKVFISLALLVSLSVFISGQSIGTLNEEFHIPVELATCDSTGCTANHAAVVMDADFHWQHLVNGTNACINDGQWDEVACPDPLTCAMNCAIEGVKEEEWKTSFGVTPWENGVQLNFVTQRPDYKNIGSRMYLMASDDVKYEMFHLKNKEFSFDTDTTLAGCGLNGAVYFVEMEEDGGLEANEGNTAGAKYGTGYCDAQCPKYLNWIGGVANDKSDSDDFPLNGACCFEMDIWEANRLANAFTIHNCETEGLYVCQEDCEKCDRVGCGSNVYALGNTKFFGVGPDFMIDTTKPFTIVTQFITSDGTDDGDLVEIKRKYVQDGNVYENPYSNLDGLGNYASESDDYCQDYKDYTGENNLIAEMGGLKAMGEAFDRGMVLAMSLWDDFGTHMLWLDSVYVDGIRGPCPEESGDPLDLEANVPDAFVRYYNFKVGAIDSTYNPKKQL